MSDRSDPDLIVIRPAQILADRWNRQWADHVREIQQRREQAAQGIADLRRVRRWIWVSRIALVITIVAALVADALGAPWAIYAAIAEGVFFGLTYTLSARATDAERGWRKLLEEG